MLWWGPELPSLTGWQTDALIHLQSITIVFLKIILTNVSAMVNHANVQNSQVMGYVHVPKSLP